MKKNINKMIILMFLCIIVYNLGHPATPALIELRGWKKSISGTSGVYEYSDVYFFALFGGFSR